MNEINLRECIEKTETPFYIYDKDILRNTVKRFRMNILPNVKICYAMKANPFMVKYMSELTDRVEVCSFGESRIVKALGIEPEKLFISGVLKKPDDLREIIDDFGDKATYTAESMTQFRLLEKEGAKRNLKLKVLLRLSDGSQFGMDRSEIEKILSENHQGTEVIGIHYFTGTQKRNSKIIQHELEALGKFLDEENSKFGHVLKHLEYGPGFKINYFEHSDDFILSQSEWDYLNELLAGLQKRYEITLEMGRVLAADAGYYATRVCDVKKNNGINFAIVDGGIHQLHYDGQIKGMYKPPIKILKDMNTDNCNEKEPRIKNKDKIKGLSDVFGKSVKTGNMENEKWTVCGSLCTTNDVLLSQQEMEDLAVGDIIVFEKVGAYSNYEGMSLFLSHELPGVYSYSRYEGIKRLRERQESYILNMPDYHGGVTGTVLSDNFWPDIDKDKT